MISFNLPNKSDLRTDFIFDSTEASLPFCLPPPPQTPKLRKRFGWCLNLKLYLMFSLSLYSFLYDIPFYWSIFFQGNWSSWGRNWDCTYFSLNRSCVSNFSMLHGIYYWQESLDDFFWCCPLKVSSESIALCIIPFWFLVVLFCLAIDWYDTSLLTLTLDDAL